MVTLDEAKAIAKRHLEGVVVSHPDFYLGLPEPKEIPEGWIFEYWFRIRSGISREDRPGWGGAPAFMVLKDGGEVQILSWQRFFKIEKSKDDVGATPEESD